MSMYRVKSVMRSFPKAMELPATSAHGRTWIRGRKEKGGGGEGGRIEHTCADVGECEARERGSVVLGGGRLRCKEGGGEGG